VSGKKGALNGLSIFGYFLCNRTIAKLAQNSTNKYPVLEIKLNKSTTPIAATNALIITTTKIAV